MTRSKAPRGAQDVRPPGSELLAEVETRARVLFDRYGYRRIDTPIFEHTDVFVRTIGESSDIVRKEMYTFEDRKGRSLTLRPEGTAPVVRAFVEHRLDAVLPMPVRLSYVGPMFRYERPQEGRQRQFLQMGVECIGSPSPLVDAEVMALGAEFYSSIGLEPELLLNSMGCAADRAAYGPKLREELESKRQALCEDCHARLDANPLRVFDCKVPSCREVLEDVTPLSGFLCHECREHLSRVRELLKSIGVPWRDAPELVRGFDYYTRTIFEFDLASLGARSAVGGGGRYDGLVEEMGGPSLPAAGMAVGVEPVLVALRNTRSVEEQAWRPDVYVAWLDQEQSTLAMTTGAALRERGMRVIVADEAKSLKAQLRAADRYGAARAVILGPQDVSRGVATVRDLAAATQEEIALDDLPARLGRHG